MADIDFFLRLLERRVVGAQSHSSFTELIGFLTGNERVSPKDARRSQHSGVRGTSADDPLDHTFDGKSVTVIPKAKSSLVRPRHVDSSEQSMSEEVRSDSKVSCCDVFHTHSQENTKPRVPHLLTSVHGVMLPVGIVSRDVLGTFAESGYQRRSGESPAAASVQELGHRFDAVVDASRPRASRAALTAALQAASRRFPAMQPVASHSDLHLSSADVSPTFQRHHCFEEVHRVCALWLLSHDLRRSAQNADKLPTDTLGATDDGTRSGRSRKRMRSECVQEDRHVLVVVRCTGDTENAASSSAARVQIASKRQALTKRRGVKSSGAAAVSHVSHATSSSAEERELLALLSDIVTLQETLRAQERSFASAQGDRCNSPILVIRFAFLVVTDSQLPPESLFVRKLQWSLSQQCVVRMFTSSDVASSAATRDTSCLLWVPDAKLAQEGLPVSASSAAAVGGDVVSDATDQDASWRELLRWRTMNNTDRVRFSFDVKSMFANPSSPSFFCRPQNLICARLLKEIVVRFPALLTPPQLMYVQQSWTARHVVADVSNAWRQLLSPFAHSRAATHVFAVDVEKDTDATGAETDLRVARSVTCTGAEKQRYVQRIIDALLDGAFWLGDSRLGSDGAAIVFSTLYEHLVLGHLSILERIPRVRQVLRTVHGDMVKDSLNSGGDEATMLGTISLESVVRYLLSVLHHRTGLDNEVIVTDIVRAERGLMCSQPQRHDLVSIPPPHSEWPLLAFQRAPVTTTARQTLFTLLRPPSRSLRDLATGYVVRQSSLLGNRFPFNFYSPEISLSHRMLYILTSHHAPAATRVTRQPHTAPTRGSNGASPWLPLGILKQVCICGICMVGDRMASFAAAAVPAPNRSHSVAQTSTHNLPMSSLDVSDLSDEAFIRALEELSRAGLIQVNAVRQAARSLLV